VSRLRELEAVVRGTLGDDLAEELAWEVKARVQERLGRLRASPLGEAIAEEKAANPDALPEETIVGALRNLLRRGGR
jgi:hypothetical protein